MLNQRGAALTLILLLVLGGLIAGGAYYLGTQQSQPSDLSQSKPTVSPTLLPSTTVIPEPSATSSAIKSVAIPSSWKSYTAEEEFRGIRITLSLPPGNKFWNESGLIIENPSKGAFYSYLSSRQYDETKKSYVNLYDGGSRRDWFERFRSGEFGPESDVEVNLPKIKFVEEIKFNNTSYLRFVAEYRVGEEELTYLFVEKGIVHMFRAADAQVDFLKNDFDKVFTSFKSQTVTPWPK